MWLFVVNLLTGGGVGSLTRSPSGSIEKAQDQEFQDRKQLQESQTQRLASGYTLSVRLAVDR